MMTNRTQKILFLIALFWLAMVLRSIIATLPPVLPTVQQELHLSNELAGATTTIPLVCFGVFAFITPSIQKRIGITAAMTLALTLITLGTLVRIFPFTAVLIFSTFCIGIGTALTNVLFPVTLRAHYPNKIAFAMGVFTVLINIGSGLGAISTPYLVSLGFSWNAALSIWSIPSILVIFFWLLSHSKVVNPAVHGAVNDSGNYIVPDGDEERMTPTRFLSFGTLVRMPLAWTIAGFMGIQGLIYYNLMTWLPTIFENTGFDSRMSSVLFGIFNTIALVGSVIGPRITISKNYKLVSAVFYGIYILSALCFPLGGYLAIGASVVAGICQGVTYTMGLTLIASQPDESIVPSISAFSQGFGYILAAIGPIMIGGLYSLFDNWWVPILSVVVAMVLNCLTFIFAKNYMLKESVVK